MALSRSLLGGCAPALLTSLLVIGSGTLSAQQPAAAAPSHDQLITAAREVMEAARFCALVTVDEAGLPRARTIDPFPPGSDMVVWLATNPRSRKVEQIRANPHVLLYYFDPEGMGYVTLTGTARLVDDPQEKARRWKEEWAGFYPDREHDELLIEVTPDRLEVLSAAHGVEGDPETWTPPSVRFGRQEADAGPS